MTKTAIKSMLRAAIFTGALGFVPTVALAAGETSPRGAEASEGVPDHAAAEARATGGETASAAGAESPPGVPDHAAAEARSRDDRGDTLSATPVEASQGVPDHAAAEARSINSPAER
jgi:hypothetical protein